MVYKLNAKEREIIKQAKLENNPNVFTRYFLKNEFSGLYFRPVIEESVIPEIQALIDEWRLRYEKLWNAWHYQKRPDFFTHKDNDYQVIYEDNPEYPTFHNNFGFILQDWQLAVARASQDTIFEITGYGSGKTIGALDYAFYLAATLPGFRCLLLGMHTKQADEAFDQAKIILDGTPYKERFCSDKGSFMNRPKRITIRNDMCRESSIDFFSIGDDIDKIKTLSIDMAIMDQAELIDDVDNVIQVVGSRFRGMVYGRQRMSKMIFLANSEDNPTLWDWYDAAVEDPDSIMAVTVSTFDNPYNTPKQLIQIEKRMGRDPNMKKQRLDGARPLGSGEHFPQTSIEAIWNHTLDDMMTAALTSKLPGYIRQEAPRAGVVKWEMPPEAGHIYLTIADPGIDNPPARNSAPIMVWDITNAPEQAPFMRAFTWVYGNMSPNPWIRQYLEYTDRYPGFNAFDSTGQLSGYDEFIWQFEHAMAEKLNLAGGMKFYHLNAAKILCARGKVQVPNIPVLFSQMAKYKLPDEKLRQDLVMTLAMSCGWLAMRWNLMNQERPEYEEREVSVAGRYARPGRAKRHRRHRR